jgi:hypothetical protein
MPMRRDCKHYETRTYASGETVHMCRLDLAPDAPWRCPDDCPKYEFRGFDAGWTMGSLARKNLPEDPPRIDEHTARLLDEAEDIVNAVGPDVLDDVEEQRARASRPSRLRRLFRRRR